MRDDAVLRRALPLGRGLGRVWTNNNLFKQIGNLFEHIVNLFEHIVMLFVQINMASYLFKQITLFNSQTLFWELGYNF